MDRDHHTAWLAELAAEDRRRRKQAAPELAQKEAALRAARVKLESSRAAVQELEAELEAEGHQTDPPDAT